MLVYIGKNYDLVRPSIGQYDEVHQDVFWYLLEQTRVSRFVGANTLREFLIRFFLISDKPIDQTAEEFINEGLIFSGRIGGQPFQFSMQDLFHFIGFGSSDVDYHVRHSLEEFIETYKRKEYLVTIKPDEERGVTSISQDAFILAMAGVSKLLQLDSLDLEFREDLLGIQPEEIARVSNFVDYVIEQIPSQFFADYQADFGEELSQYAEYYIKIEAVEFDPLAQMPKASLITILEIFFGEDDPLVVRYRESEELDEDLTCDLNLYSPYIRFAYGVKHGYVDLNDEWRYAYKSYSPKFKLDPLEELAGEDSEMYSTNYIYTAWNMDEWIHLIP